MHTNQILLANLALAKGAHGQAAGATNTELQKSFPTPVGTPKMSNKVITVAAGQTYDGKMALHDRSPSTCQGLAALSGGTKEAMFALEDGATLSNVILGKNNGEGVHCLGTCTLNNVWWTDVCEDAATFKQKSGASYVNGGGAQNAADKIFQHNGAGTVHIRNFLAIKSGKLWRSCGNCATNQPDRHVNITNSIIVDVKNVAGVNANNGDTAIMTNVCYDGKSACAQFQSASPGSQPRQIATANTDAQSNKFCQIKGMKSTGCLQRKNRRDGREGLKLKMKMLVFQ